tara:strand:+ start:56 stop:361 length:306 start_codon:yes stop_codon:yes gene_type:complete
MNIRKDDMVKIITGKDRGKSGRVIKVFPAKDRLIVEGLNLVKKHQRPTQENQQGGIIEKEASIHRSNVMLLLNNKATRISYKISDNGKKIRYSNKLKGNID